MPKLRAPSLIACLPLVTALMIGACDRKKEPAGQGDKAAAPVAGPVEPPSATPKMLVRDHKGEKMPELPFAGPDGAPATLGPMRGHPVLVNLWATWCRPCIAELPALDRLAAARKGTLAVVAVSQDSQGPAVVRPFWAARGYKTLLPYTDARMVLTKAVGADGYPTSILYNAKGREVWRVMGDLDWTGPAAAALLAEAK